MTSLAERAAKLSPQAREVMARELIRAGTAFPVDQVAEPVAVVGIGCRLPGGVVGPESFWRLLVNGTDAVSEVPADRWDAEALYDPDPLAPGRMTTKWGGFVSDVAGFDADFFGITPREAATMDPQQRMLLEVAWEALEHAGIAPDSLGGTRTGVMMGLATWDYTIVNLERGAEADAYFGTGNTHSTAVGRISYLLGLQGPSVAVDTACSSSLVAVHMACQSLRLRESDVALAGGVQLCLSPFTSIALSKWSALSPRGRCQSFDAGADGFIRSEGAGVVVLKRLADAVRDCDRVLAVVRGSAVNHDGRSSGLTAPNVLAQRDVITDALRVAEIAPDTVNYIEGHGTGTVLGDSIELEALANTYGRGETRCALGAVKTNLGHLEAAAGVAGFIKAVLTVERGQIPPSLHFSRWNPAIDAATTRLFVPTDTAPWPDCPGPRRAAVSAFGLGGTNAHVVLEQGPVADPVAAQPEPAATTLVVSGKSDERVAATAGVLAEWLDGEGAAVALADVAHTLNHHRARHPRFATVTAADRAQAVAGLRALAAGVPADGVVAPHQGPWPETDHPPEPHAVIPTTPWQHTDYWLSPPAAQVPQPGDTAWSPAQHWITIKERMEAAISAPGAGSLLGEHIGVSTTPPVHLWQALLNAETKPYPGCHRIRGVDVVPESVLLQTLATAAAECGASALSDVHLENPIAVDEPRVIQVVADGESVTVLSACTADAPAHDWIRHAGARICLRPPDERADARQVPGDDTASVDESLATLQQACGIEGQAFRWSIGSCRLGPDGLRANVDLPEASTVALLDVAIQLARLVDGSGQRLMVPAAAESVRFPAGLVDRQACIEVHRRNDDGDGLVVDIIVTTPDGTTCVDIRSLRYAGMDSAAAPAVPDADGPPAKWDWAQVAAADMPGELVARLRAMIARELGVPPAAVDVDLPFPELGLDSIMATSILRQGRQSLGIDLSSSMFWDHPTISSLVAHLVELLAPQHVPQDDSAGAEVSPAESTAGVLDELFDSVDSASAGGGG